MEINNRKKDLTQIFDDRWNATKNANQYVQEVHEHDNKMTNRMFNIKEHQQQPKINYMEENLNRLKGNMDALRNNRNKF